MYEEFNPTSLLLSLITRTQTSLQILDTYFYSFTDMSHLNIILSMFLVSYQNSSSTSSDSPGCSVRVHVGQALDKIFLLLVKKTSMSVLISVVCSSDLIYNSFCRSLLDSRCCKSSCLLLFSDNETKLFEDLRISLLSQSVLGGKMILLKCAIYVTKHTRIPRFGISMKEVKALVSGKIDSPTVPEQFIHYSLNIRKFREI